MATHSALATVALRAPLALIQVSTIPPSEGEVLILVQYAASTPFDMHQNDGGVAVNNYPQVLGDTLAGVVEDVGAGVSNLAVGDRVTFLYFDFPKTRKRQQMSFSDSGTI